MSLKVKRGFRSVGWIAIGALVGLVYGIALPAAAGESATETMGQFGVRDIVQFVGLIGALGGLYLAQDRRISESDKLRDVATTAIRSDLTALREMVVQRLDGRGGINDRLDDLEK